MKKIPRKMQRKFFTLILKYLGFPENPEETNVVIFLTLKCPLEPDVVATDVGIARCVLGKNIFQDCF